MVGLVPLFKAVLEAISMSSSTEPVKAIVTVRSAGIVSIQWTNRSVLPQPLVCVMANRLSAVIYRLETASGAPNREDLVSNVERLRVLVETLELQLGMGGIASITDTSETTARATCGTDIASTAGQTTTNPERIDDHDSQQDTTRKTAPSGGCCTIL